jgi:hypothetical protein
VVLKADVAPVEPQRRRGEADVAVERPFLRQLRQVEHGAARPFRRDGDAATDDAHLLFQHHHGVGLALDALKALMGEQHRGADGGMAGETAVRAPG